MLSAEELIHASNLAGLSNHDLIAKLKSWAAKERRVTLGVLFLLNEVERRKLHLDQYSSLFAYCTDRLGYSNSAAGRRIAAARCLRGFPAVVPMLLDGRLNLTTLCIFARVLTEENAADLLARGAGASQESAELLAAEFGAPKPARDRIKPVKSPQDSQSRDAQPNREGSRDHGSGRAAPSSADPSSMDPSSADPSSMDPHLKEQAGATHSTEADTDHGKTQGDGARGSYSASDEAAGNPDGRTGSAMYDVKFRADGELVEKLRRAQALLSSAQSNPSLAFVVDRALELLLDRHDPARREARRQTRQTLRRHSGTTKNPEARTDQPRSGPEHGSEPRAQEDLSDASNVGPEQKRRTDQPRPRPEPGSEFRAQEDRSDAPNVGPEQERSPARRRFTSQQVRDQVFLLFGMQCAFVGPEGRCPVTRNLDLDHVLPVAAGGSDDAANLRPMCVGHNQRAADRVFGSAFMDRKRSRTPAPGVRRANSAPGQPLRERGARKGRALPLRE